MTRCSSWRFPVGSIDRGGLLALAEAGKLAIEVGHPSLAVQGRHYRQSSTSARPRPRQLAHRVEPFLSRKETPDPSFESGAASLTKSWSRINRQPNRLSD